jgi:RND family efflux transporter MFP subunit
MAMRTRLTPLAILLAGWGCSDSVATLDEAKPAPRVAVVAVGSETAVRTITAVGAFEPVARVLVAAQTEGVVTAVHVREGDRVVSGQLVVELDAREIRAELAEARANLDEANASWKRVESLHDTGLAPAQELDAATAALRVSQARIDALETRLSFTRLTAPVSGVVTDRRVEVGNLASPREPLVELAAGDGLLLRVPVSELEVVHLHTGDVETVTVDALPELRLEGRIERIFPAADSVSRQVTVEVKVNQAPPAVRYGFLGRAHLVLDRIGDALVVPEPAIQRGAEGGTFVWVVENGVARMREITVGQRFDNRAVVSSGLLEGEQVVVEGVARLSDGIAVTVSSSAAETAS